jgi:tetratricopeptide (TPR) repeat protein
MRKASFVLGSMLAVTGWLGVAGTALLVVPATAEAQEKVSQKVGVPLKAAQDAIARKRWDQALAKIKEADVAPAKTAFDQYKINEMLWYVYLQQGRNADAARVLEGQIASGQMPANEKVQRQKTLAQLYARSGSYGKAAQAAQSYLKSVPGDKDMQLLVANAYYMQKDYKGAIAAADRIMKAGGTPSQDLLQLVLRSNYELNDSAGTARALEQLLRYYPSEDTWVRVIDGFLKVTKQDDELMALYRLAEDVGALKEPRQYVDMTQALVIGGFGQEGERIMQKGIAANLFQGEDLNRAQRTLDAAKRKGDQERAALSKAAGQLAAAKTGDDMINVAKLYFSAGDYAQAVSALQKAVAKGGVQDADGANMLLGIASKRKGDKNGAMQAFSSVKDPKFAEVARLWKMAAR